MLFNGVTMIINDYLNSSFTVQANGCQNSGEQYKLHEFVLKEDDNSSSHEVKIKFSPRKFKVTVFNSDYKSNNQSDNLLKIFDNSILNLTRVPDYILFIEHSETYKIIVVEMKSSRPNPNNENFSSDIEEYNQKLKAKFSNGKSISQFIFNVLNKNVMENDICNLLCIKPLENQLNKEDVHPDNHNTATDSIDDMTWFYEYGEEFRIRDLLKNCFGMTI